MNKKYLILGRGWLGNMLLKYLGENARIYDGRFFGGIVGGHIFQDYDVMINTIAKTNIDLCEKNKLEAFETNTILATSLADKARQDGKKYVFISSACIFESKNLKDIKYEDSKPNPQCFYALTKWMAEELITEVNPDALIVRPRLPLSEVPHPRNTINKLLTYNKINTNQESVTVVEDFIPTLIELIRNDCKGIYHLINEGTISPAEIAELLGHKFKKVSKKSQDKRLAIEGRAKRVTTYAGSNKIALLPNIRERIKTLAEKYKS